MKSVIVASSKKHAETMIGWLKLDPEIWVGMAYGDPVIQMYTEAKLIRPSEGINQGLSDWILEKLLPYICLTIGTVPPNWCIPQEHVA